MGIATVNGIEIGYDDVGQGVPLVLVHGHPFDRSMWAPQVAAFADVARVIVPDLRGYGASTVTGAGTTWESYARDVLGLLDRLDARRVVLAGLSMGGQIVMECWRLGAPRIAALVLADTSARAETEQGRRQRAAMADTLLAEGMRGYADENLGRMLAPHNVVAMPAVAAHVHAMMVGAPPEGAAAALRARATRPDYSDLLAGVSVPTLVLVGADDAFTPVATAREMSARLPRATLAVVEGAGHLPNLEQPAVVNALLRDFLAAHDLVGGARPVSP